MLENYFFVDFILSFSAVFSFKLPFQLFFFFVPDYDFMSLFVKKCTNFPSYNGQFETYFRIEI